MTHGFQRRGFDSFYEFNTNSNANLPLTVVILLKLSSDFKITYLVTRQDQAC